MPGKKREERNTKIGLFPYLRESEMVKNTKFLNNVESFLAERTKRLGLEVIMSEISIF